MHCAGIAYTTEEFLGPILEEEGSDGYHSNKSFHGEVTEFQNLKFPEKQTGRGLTLPPVRT
jgi:hypothetical protein